VVPLANPPPDVQAKLLPEGLAVTVSVTTELLPQPRVAVCAGALSVGVTRLLVMVTTAGAVEVHPLLVLVTCKEYVPVAFTFTFAEFPPLTMPGPLQV
jgi:hypothetical protein